MISVVLIGAGNVAIHLYKAFNNAENIVVNQWYNRGLKPLQPFKNNVEITNDLSQLKNADIYIIAVSDDAISQLSSQLLFENRFVVHTSGSKSLHNLDKKHQRGVFYPLQTFSKNTELNFETVPFCIVSKLNIKVT